MSVNTIITTGGINAVMSASPTGPLVAIKYFVPVYDYRLDTSVHNNYNTSAINYSTTVSATSAASFPPGEIIWNTSGTGDYNLSQEYILSGFGGALCTNSLQSSMGVGTNLYKGQPLLNSVSGTGAFSPPNLTTTHWTITASGGVSGVDLHTTSARNMYFPVDNYFPVLDTSGNLQGAFKAHLNQPIGRFKFNKVAYYAVKVSPTGVEDTSVAPVFFAESFVKEVAVKSNIAQEGYDDFIFDAEIDFTPINSYGTSAFYMSSGNDLAPTVGGLYSVDPIGIGDGSNIPLLADLHVRYTGKNTDLVRFDASGADGNTNFQTINITPDGNMYVSGTNQLYLLEPTNTHDIFPIGITDSIGADTGPYNNVYANSGTFAQVSATDVLAVNIQVGNLLSANDVHIGGTTSASKIVPILDSTYDIGDITAKYNNIFVNTVNGTDFIATTSIQTADILATGNINAQGGISTDGSLIVTGNVNPSTFAGDVSAAGNVSATEFFGNVYAGNISATGNISAAGNVSATRYYGIFDGGVTGAVTGTNVTCVTLSASGNISGLDIFCRNLNASNYISAAGNLYSSAVTTSGNISALGDIRGANVYALKDFTSKVQTYNVLTDKISTNIGTSIAIISPINITGNISASNYIGKVNGETITYEAIRCSGTGFINDNDPDINQIGITIKKEIYPVLSPGGNYNQRAIVTLHIPSILDFTSSPTMSISKYGGGTNVLNAYKPDINSYPSNGHSTDFNTSGVIIPIFVYNAFTGGTNALDTTPMPGAIQITSAGEIKFLTAVCNTGAGTVSYYTSPKYSYNFISNSNYKKGFPSFTVQYASTV